MSFATGEHIEGNVRADVDEGIVVQPATIERAPTIWNEERPPRLMAEPETPTTIVYTLSPSVAFEVAVTVKEADEVAPDATTTEAGLKVTLIPAVGVRVTEPPVAALSRMI